MISDKKRTQQIRKQAILSSKNCMHQRKKRIMLDKQKAYSVNVAGKKKKLKAAKAKKKAQKATSNPESRHLLKRLFT